MSTSRGCFRKILIANRGEIACRVLRTLREMGIGSVAVHSEVDRGSPHVWMADEAVELSGPPASYLDIEQILAAARSTGADAIHPGYGFLSQNATFASACAEAGIVFIGPSPAAMVALGNKEGSRKTAEMLEVPVIPGATECTNVEAARRAASGIGYPILVKAAGGGGGKGMRLVRSEAELKDSFESAARESKAAFADDRLLLEKYIHPARHVEVQILGDGTDAVALGERECSLQRRYQKIIEESPSPGITETVRRQLFESAVKLARAAGYASAGTVEFLVGQRGDFYFLEVNTRLQVEHPVTELLTGIDIVREQIEIAAGGRLLQPASPRGHAIEARLNAEDPYREFLPSSGRVLMLEWPLRPHVRIDAGIVEGFDVQPFYDPLLAKIIAWGPDRERSRSRLATALRETTLLGLTTNQPFLIGLLEEELFIQGQTYTTTVESKSWPEPPVPDFVRVAAERVPGGRAIGSTQTGTVGDAYSPWASLGGFRMGA